MAGLDDIVVTGLGCVSPLGIGCESMRESLIDNRCAIRQLIALNDERATTYYGATVDDFDGKQFVKPRKAIKVMSRAVQMAYTSAQLAWQHAGLAENDQELNADRMGVVYGSEILPCDTSEVEAAVRACSSDGVMDHSQWGDEFAKHIYPLWMLRNLPNMPACHIGIAIDARGPNNTIAQEEVSSLLAIAEAASIIRRGQADLMVTGGLGSRVIATRLAFRAGSLYDQNPAETTSDESIRSAPFGALRHGIAASEGAGALILETRRHAVARGAKILARLAGTSSRFAAPKPNYGGSRKAVADSSKDALDASSIGPEDLDHCVSQGYSHPVLDVEEGCGIESVIGDKPVIAPSSYLGTAGAASSVLEIIASLLCMQEGFRLPVNGGYTAHQECKVNLCTERVQTSSPFMLKTAFAPTGHAAAAVFECET